MVLSCHIEATYGWHKIAIFGRFASIDLKKGAAKSADTAQQKSSYSAYSRFDFDRPRLLMKFWWPHMNLLNVSWSSSRSQAGGNVAPQMGLGQALCSPFALPLINTFVRL